MSKILKINLILLLFILFVNLVNAESIQPNYQVLGFSAKSEYDKGENATINIVIDGIGKLQNDGVFYFYIPDYIVKEKKVEVVYYNLRNASIECNLNQNCMYPIDIYKLNDAFPSFTAVVNHNLFNEDFRKVLTNKVTYEEGEYRYPYQVNFIIDKNSPSGEHPIYLSFSYVYNNKVYLSNYIAKIKIRAWYEQNWIQFILLIVAILTIYSIVDKNHYLWNKFKNYIKRSVYKT